MMNINKMKALSLILTAAMAASLTACAGSESAKETTARETKSIEAGGSSDSTAAADSTAVADSTAAAESVAADSTEAALDIENTSEKYADLRHAADHLALKLLQGRGGGKENLLISPASILAAFRIALDGADGETKEQIIEALGGGEWSKETADWISGLVTEGDSKALFADSVWVRDDADWFSPDQNFIEKESQKGAEVFLRPFADTALPGEINSWVSKKTNDMIPETLTEIPKDAVMYLINAVSFDAKWAVPYDLDHVIDTDFTDDSGKSSSVSMMCSDEYEYIHDDKAQGFIKDYTEGYSFVAIRPDDGVTLEDYLHELTPEALSAIIGSASEEKVITGLPKFSDDYSAELSADLEAMGMTDAFDPDRASFPGFGTAKDRNLVISDVIHKTRINVDELGTQAGAVTAIGVRAAMSMQEQPKEVILDKPFLYFLMDRETMIPIFAGTVTSIPSSDSTDT